MELYVFEFGTNKTGRRVRWVRVVAELETAKFRYPTVAEWQECYRTTSAVSLDPGPNWGK